MAKPSRKQSDYDEILYGEDHQQIDVEVDEEEIEAVARSTSDDADDDDVRYDGADGRRRELARRCDTLIRLVEKENQEYDQRERQARKEKKLAKSMILSKRGGISKPANESLSSRRKRMQSSMDDYLSSVKRRR